MQPYEHGGNTFGHLNIALDFSINVHPLGMPEAAKQAIRESMDSFSAYPDCDCRALRAALSEKHAIAAESILCGNGASDLIFRICACLKPKLALTLAPTFSEYKRAVTLFGGTMREFPLLEENAFLPTEDMLSAMTPEVDIVFLCNPNNPTGRLIEPALLDRVLERCNDNGIFLVVDECFLAFTEGESLLPALARYPKLLILKAFTKFYGMAGLRLGYLLSSPQLLERIRPFGPEWSVSSVAQAAGTAAFTEPDWGARTHALISTERTYMSDALSGLGLRVFPSDSNFLLIKSDMPLYTALRKKGILVRACDNFSGLSERYIRIGLKTHDKNSALISAIREALHG